MQITIRNIQEKQGLPASHIGLIPDGIRRWAKINHVSLLEAYLIGIEKLSEITKMFYKNNIETISIYASSIYNFSRSEEEINAFCKAEALFCREHLPKISQEFGTRVFAPGNLEVLPDYFVVDLKMIMNMTSRYNKTKLYLLVGYDPINEIMQAIIKSKKIENFPEKLEVIEPLDFIVRTSGANLLSNFLPLQSGFARLYFCKKLFNDSKLEDFAKILDEFNSLYRRYGE